MAIPEEVRRYWLSILLVAAGFLFQLLVLPKSFSPSHYDALGIPRYASVEKVVEANELLSKECIRALEQAPEAGSRAKLERVFYSNNAGHEALVKMCADEHMQQWKVLHGGCRVVGYIGLPSCRGMYSFILKLNSERLVGDVVESVAECGSVRLSLMLELQRRYTEINGKVAIAGTRLSLMQEDMMLVSSFKEKEMSRVKKSYHIMPSPIHALIRFS